MGESKIKEQYNVILRKVRDGAQHIEARQLETVSIIHLTAKLAHAALGLDFEIDSVDLLMRDSFKIQDSNHNRLWRNLLDTLRKLGGNYPNGVVPSETMKQFYAVAKDKLDLSEQDVNRRAELAGVIERVRGDYSANHMINGVQVRGVKVSTVREVAAK